MMVANVTGLRPGEFVHTLGDAHLYLNHLDQASLQITRSPHSLPKMIINPDIKNISDFRYEDFVLMATRRILILRRLSLYKPNDFEGVFLSLPPFHQTGLLEEIMIFHGVCLLI